MEQALSRLPRGAQLAFALSCCERLYPNYLAFKRETGRGKPDVLREALDLAWSVLDGVRPTPHSVALAREQVQAAEPETEHFNTILVSLALDAAACAGLVLQFIEDGRVGKVVEIASLCRDTVDMFVRDTDGLTPINPGLEEKILNHRLMQLELKRQHDDLLMLRSFSGLATETAELRRKWRNPSRSNIDLSG